MRSVASACAAAVLLLFTQPAVAQSAARTAETAGPAPAWLDAARAGLRHPGADMEAHLGLVRALYFRAVDDEAAVVEGLAALDTMARRWPPLLRTEAALRDAYRGALVTLRAKHGWWPPDRLKHTRTGLALLDTAVAAAPADAEVRYLRLMSGFYLPGIFGRGDAVREDLAALAVLLPVARERYPEVMWARVVRFVLAEAHLDAHQRAALLRLLPVEGLGGERG